jgi:hypothetical protein
VKPKRPKLRKLKPARPQSRAAQKKQNAHHLRQLVKTTRVSGRMARHMASLLNLVPDKNIPDTFLREIDNLHRLMTGAKLPTPKRNVRI